MAQTVGSCGAKFVLVALANYADDKGDCWPSQNALAADTDQSARSVRAHLATLEASGFIERHDRRRPNGSFTSDAFHLRQNPPAAKSASGESCQRQETSRPAAKSAGPEPSVEPSVTAPPVSPKPKRPRQPTGDTDLVEAQFARCWALYPKRAGGNSRADALKQFRARRHEGVAAEDMEQGTVRYAAYVRAAGKERTELVMQAQRFYGKGEHWTEDWEIPANEDRQDPTPEDRKRQRQDAAIAQWERDNPDPADQLRRWADGKAASLLMRGADAENYARQCYRASILHKLGEAA